MTTEEAGGRGEGCRRVGQEGLLLGISRPAPLSSAPRRAGCLQGLFPSPRHQALLGREAGLGEEGGGNTSGKQCFKLQFVLAKQFSPF